MDKPVKPTEKTDNTPPLEKEFTGYDPVESGLTFDDEKEDPN